MNGGFGLKREMSKFAMKGVPASIRREFYLSFFGIEDVARESKYIAKTHDPLIEKYEYLVDEIGKDDIWVSAVPLFCRNSAITRPTFCSRAMLRGPFSV